MEKIWKADVKWICEAIITWPSKNSATHAMPRSYCRETPKEGNHVPHALEYARYDTSVEYVVRQTRVTELSTRCIIPGTVYRYIPQYIPLRSVSTHRSTYYHSLSVHAFGNQRPHKKEKHVPHALEIAHYDTSVEYVVHQTRAPELSTRYVSPGTVCRYIPRYISARSVRTCLR